MTELLLLSVFVIVFISPLIRRAYRKRVIRLMGLNQVQARPAGWWEAHTSEPSKPSALSSQAQPDIAKDGEAWELQILRATLSAWVSFVLIAPVVASWTVPGSNRLFLLEFAVGAGLLAMAPVLVNLTTRWRRKPLMIALAIGVVVIGIMEVVELSANTGSSDDGPMDWGDLIAFLLIAPMYLALFHHRLRGLIIPSCVVAAVFLLVLTSPITIGQIDKDLYVSSLTAGSAVIAAAGALLSMFGLWLGFQAVGVLARLVESGWMGDHSMVSLIGLILIAVVMVFGALADNESTRLAGWLPLLWVAGPVIIYVIVLGKRPLAGPAPALLVLRVFSKDRRQQALLEELQGRWRYLGAVHQAGGPDMVDLNVTPYQCAMFLSSRLHDLYLPQALSAAHLMARFNDKPDHEGRYRVNEMFNFNTAWRSNVEQLILNSETILLDLRGLTAEREGTSFEIGLLARHRLISRVVAIGDDKTDWEHVNHQLQREEQSLEQLNRVDISTEKNLDKLFTELLKITARPKSDT